MNPLSCFLVTLLAAAPALAGGTDPSKSSKPFLLEQAGILLKVSASGSVSDSSCVPRVAPPICSLLLRALPTWKFAPGQRGGLAVDMDAALTLSLVAVPKPGGFGVQATRAWLNPRPAPTNQPETALETRRTNPPRYPPDAQRRGKTGTVILELWREPDSKVPRVGKIWFEGKPADGRNAFVAATLDAVAKWTVDPGVPEQLSYCIPVEYSLGGDARPPKGTEPCEATYVEGFAPPKLLTDVTAAKL